MIVGADKHDLPSNDNIIVNIMNSITMESPNITDRYVENENSDHQNDPPESCNTDDIQSNGDITGREGNDKPKASRKRLKEIEKLKMNHNYESTEEFDAFEDGNQIHRKYRLREKQSIEEPKPPPKSTKRRRRISIDAGTVMYDCQTCGKEFTAKTSLLNHMRMHQTKITYTCALCFENFDANDALKEHKSVHDEENRVFMCAECKMAFSDHCAFLIHSLSHIMRSYYKCIECGRAYNQKASYKVHIYTHYHRKLKCPLCPAEVNGEANLAGHISGHNQERNCVECGKMCRNASASTYHMLSHTGLKPFQCLYCGVGFKNQAQRRVHTRQHTGERPYSCDLCDSTFIQYTDMKKHKTTHEKEKKYKCDQCQKMFHHKGSLIIHMRGHMRDNLYVCPRCKASFTTMRGLECHTMYKHLSERPVRCELCDKGFINKNMYQKHCRSKYHKRNEYGSNLEKLEKE